MPGGDTDAALVLFDQHGADVGHAERMEFRFRLWEVTQDKTHLAEAHRLLEHLRDHAPEADRVSMIERVPLHREITLAWENK